MLIEYVMDEALVIAHLRTIAVVVGRLDTGKLRELVELGRAVFTTVY